MESLNLVTLFTEMQLYKAYIECILLTFYFVIEFPQEKKDIYAERNAFLAIYYIVVIDLHGQLFDHLSFGFFRVSMTICLRILYVISL